MSIEELRALPVGAAITYIVGTGGGEERHPAEIVDHAHGWSGILVRFTTKPQRKLRWSTATNRPVGAKTHLGTVRLEK